MGSFVRRRIRGRRGKWIVGEEKRFAYIGRQEMNSCLLKEIIGKKGLLLSDGRLPEHRL